MVNTWDNNGLVGGKTTIVRINHYITIIYLLLG